MNVLVVGDGRLADCTCRELSACCQIVRQVVLETGVPADVDLALVLHDGWHPSILQEAEERFALTGIPWLRSFIAFGEGVTGPFVRPGVPGCSRCADMRQLMAGRDRKEMWEMQMRMYESGGRPHDPWASQTALLQLANLLASEVRRFLEGRQMQTEGHIYLLNLKTLRLSRHVFLPDPYCTVCGRLPDDTADLAKLTLKPSPKVNTDSFRSRPMEELKQVLAHDYLDQRTGFFNGKMRDLISPFADVSVNLPLFAGDEAASGRTHSYAESELTAILEGLERYCGMAPRGKRTVVRDSFRNLQAHALDPVTVGLHAAEQYEKPNFPFQPYDPERPMEWVWGYSFLRERPILVPERLAYYSLGQGQGFVFETSNGCALGGSLEEAILHGILEVVERDSFLLTWYAQLPLPRLDPDSAGDRELSLMIERIRAVAGYDIHLFNATMENRIPSVWTVAKNRKETGINLVCAGGAHPDPVRAVKSSLLETAAMLLTLNDKFEAHREQYLRMFHDSNLVRKMDDHAMLYALPEAEERLHFLLHEDRPLRTFAEEFKPVQRNSDLTDDLRCMLQTFRRLNLDVIVVDQTSPEISRNGLYCVKVLIPGMLPMTFGHHLTRLAGLERVLRVPAELGYVPKPLTMEQLNPHPHPFP